MSRVNRKRGRFELFCRRQGIDPALAKAALLTFAAFAYLAAR
jgi:hypothetical protein